jgi:cell division protein FtsI/penicillin-binding protein 2
VSDARTANRRIRLLALLFAAAFAATLARAVWIQGVQAGSLDRLAANQQTEVVTLPARRGSILDQRGLELAVGQQRTTVYADPRHVKNPRALVRAAHTFLGVDATALTRALANRKSSFVYVARQADSVRAQKLLALKLLGVGSYPEEKRVYPLQTVAPQLVGFAGVDNKGLEGLELGYDNALRGRPGEETIVKDPSGQTINVLKSRPEQDGSDLVLTLDHTIQQDAEQVLRRTVAHWGAKGATAIVLDPRTGAVLAMASVPTYDVNKAAAAPQALHRNRAVTDTYEPGSTFKLVTVAGALSEHVVTPRTPFTLPYSIHVADKVIHDAERRPTVRLTVADILSHSSNVGAITLSRLLGKASLARWIKRFGFGAATGIDFPGESAGNVPPVEHWYGSVEGNIPIGQGLAVTPLQMAAAYAAIANGGVWEQPHILDHVAGRKGPKLKHRRVVSESVAQEMMKMLQGVVDEAVGTGTLARVAGYHVAGKTGTAAKPDGKGGYSTRDYVASFVGAVPATNPRLVILVSVDSPRGSIWGGVVAAPAFSDIARFDLQYLEVIPDAPGGGDEAKAPQ